MASSSYCNNFILWCGLSQWRDICPHLPKFVWAADGCNSESFPQVRIDCMNPSVTSALRAALWNTKKCPLCYSEWHCSVQQQQGFKKKRVKHKLAKCKSYSMNSCSCHLSLICVLTKLFDRGIFKSLGKRTLPIYFFRLSTYLSISLELKSLLIAFLLNLQKYSRTL